MKSTRLNIRTRTDIVLVMSKMRDAGQVYKRFDELVMACGRAVNFPGLRSHHLISIIRSYPEFKRLYRSHELSREGKKRDVEKLLDRLSDIERRLEDLTTRVGIVTNRVIKKEFSDATDNRP